MITLKYISQLKILCPYCDENIHIQHKYISPNKKLLALADDVLLAVKNAYESFNVLNTVAKENDLNKNHKIKALFRLLQGLADSSQLIL